MSKTIRFKLSEEEYKVVLQSAQGIGISADKLAYQALAYVLRQARQLSKEVDNGTIRDDTTPPVDQADSTGTPGE